MRILLLSLAFLSLCAFTVHDGDTITGIRYRLAYIDAPELKQTCHVNGLPVPIGKISRDHLLGLTKKVSECHIVDIDRYGRAVADCPFNMVMVRDGMAVCYDKYIGDDEISSLCHEFQSYAKNKKLGIWQCEDLVMPSVFRRKHK